MTTQDGFGSSHEIWDAAYQQGGINDVEARQHLYDLVRLGEEFVDLYSLLIDTINFVFPSREVAICDVGCSSGKWLFQCIEQGIRGRLIGVDRNERQFAAASYWDKAPSDAFEGFEPPIDYLLQPQEASHPRLYDLIEFYRSSATALPLGQASVDVTVFNFMFYHLTPAEQRQAFAEAKRITNFDHGFVAESTRGEENKAEMRIKEAEIARILSEMIGQQVLHPKPINEGHTVEASNKLVPEMFECVYVNARQGDIFIDNMAKFEALRAAHATLAGMYVLAEDVSIPVPRELYDEAFNIAYAGVVRGIKRGKPFIDKRVEAQFIASENTGLILPEYYSRAA